VEHIIEQHALMYSEPCILEFIRIITSILVHSNDAAFALFNALQLSVLQITDRYFLRDAHSDQAIASRHSLVVGSTKQ